jgi:hypothetical protein
MSAENGFYDDDIHKINEELAEVKSDIELIKEKLLIKPSTEQIDVIKVLGFTLMLVIIVLGIFVCLARIDKKIDDLGTPIVTRGGNIMPLPPDAKIKFWPNDFDTVKKKK